MMLLATAIVPARAQGTDVNALSLEQLANVEVTSVSRRPEPLNRAPSSIFVITNEDIRRSGFASLPEVLRLAPNLEVAKINGYTYTISARGFNSPESANKLLVLIDGRSIYSPLASTVFWENIDVPLADIERIEVVSGPGGTLYGANAVNGVINIITKNAADTKGGLVEARTAVSGNGLGGYRGMLRYGFEPWDGGAVRLYGQVTRGGSTPPVSALDTSKTGLARADMGFRFDQVLGADTFDMEGEIFADHTTQSNLEKARGANLNLHWTHNFDGGDSLMAQFTGDNSARIIPGQREELTTYGVQIQHNTSVFGTDAFIWGGEYRQFKESYYTPGLGFGFANPSNTISLWNVFAQEEYPLLDNLKATLGLKLEDNSYSGLDPMPNIKLAWQVSDTDMLWASFSQAVRTPSKVDRELAAPGILLPSPNFQSEKLTAYELGYRGEPAPRLSLSATLFYNLYDDLRSDQPTPVTVFPITLVNGTKGNTWGTEIWAKYGLTDWWGLSAGYTWLNKDFYTKPGFIDIANGQSEGQDPASQGQIRSQMNLFRDFEFDVDLRGVGKVTTGLSGTAPVSLVPGYPEGDVRLGWHVFPSTELDFTVNNILHDRHLEVRDPSTAPPQYVTRSFVLSIRQSF